MQNFEPLLRYKQYEEQLAKTRKANKEQEAATAVPEVMKQRLTIAWVKLDFVQAIEHKSQTEPHKVNGIVPGQEWERVSKHCDFSAKVHHTFHLQDHESTIFFWCVTILVF